MSINRQLPRAIEEVWIALLTAQSKKDNKNSGDNILSPSTAAKVDAIIAKFGAARTFNIMKQGIAHHSTSDKDKLMANQIMYNSHYIQVLNLHIDEKILLPSHRCLYNIPASSGSVPHQRSAAEVNLLSRDIINGEPLMIAAGGKAIPFPTLQTIKDNYALLVKSETDHSIAMSAAIQSQEILTAMLPEAILVVKKVWDEVETFYNEGSNKSKRKFARNWGVVYISTKGSVTITCHVVEMIGDKPVAVAGMNVLLVETGESAITTKEGEGLIKTHITDEATIRLSMQDYETKEIKCELPDGKSFDLGVVTVVRKPA